MKTIEEFLLDPRGEKKHCAFCKYFEPYSHRRMLHNTGYGDCRVPDEAVIVPHSYRANNEGTAAYYGIDCAFFERIRTELPNWDFLKKNTPVLYDTADDESMCR